ncbi:uncharacterized protein LY89DRAFT_644945 [Mollisia scopiformis]|uniref:LicD/FKTN/FKRP nucleotidyltransferase domain-containing protein n=1 Tax=Mollisia scopiformis TaxID=149040 RepID=A0A194XBA2_MOLSC|nr:uncharacterized protein LY89DRAFT_644945 [Mollisia scopiformis]KUJ17450.1 hypothetical protein LY89DRAFT_644945 [Mollisia scopiformis]
MRTRILLRISSVFTLCLLLYRLMHLTPQHLEPLPLPQYFTEVDFRFESRLIGAVSHIDTRFSPTKALSIDQVHHALINLLKSYFFIMKDLGFETWLAHGTLLGWHWGGRIFPWDTDIDVQMSPDVASPPHTIVTVLSHVDVLALLATDYNATVFQYLDEEEIHTYLLDINPHYLITSTQDLSNKIDARWIDIQSGKYIDITALRRRDLDPNVLYCKDGHEYMDEDIYPLQVSVFEGIDVKIPSKSEVVLVTEYGKNALTSKNHHWYIFDDYSQTWMPEQQNNG